MKRWEVALKEVGSSSNLERELDVIHAFFMNCYHLRDWLEESVVVDKARLDDFFAQNKEMRICRDLCNASKHMVLRQPSFDGDPDVPGDMVTVAREYVPPDDYKLAILVDFEKYYIPELANTCVELWTKFLENNGLM